MRPLTLEHQSWIKKNGANGFFLISVHVETKIQQEGKNKKTTTEGKTLV